MDRIRIVGGKPLFGRIPISGAKNAALPLIAASLLTEGTLTLTNMPKLADIRTMKKLLAQHGVAIKDDTMPMNGQTVDKLSLTAATLDNLTAPYDLVRQMRASVLVLGPLLARAGYARVSLPGGCAIGTRPIDLHLDALGKLGAEISLSEGYVEARSSGRLKGATIIFPKVTVGGTENVLMAAVLAEGTTTLGNAAQEPEVCDLADCLNAMGAKISGIGTSTLKIEGVEKLHSAEHCVIADRIEAGTYAMAAAITRGKVELVGARMDIMEQAAMVLTDLGVYLTEHDDIIEVDAQNAVLVGTDVMTEPHPGFPTDLQAQIMTLMTTAHGASMISETVFENRFMHVPELRRMGANINVLGTSAAIIRGVKELSGAQVMATDLRASVSLVMAGLAAKGETIVNRVYHLDRGYERLEEKLAACGAEIERLHD